LGTGVEEYGSISLLVKEVVGDGANIFLMKALEFFACGGIYFMILLQNKMVVFFPGKRCGVHWINYIFFTISQYYFFHGKRGNEC
jgi:hypothetical protein